MWGQVLGAVAGGLLGGSGSSGGGTPNWLKPYLKDTAANAANLPQQQYFPGQTFVGGLPSEQAAFDMRGQYNQGMYGPGGFFGATVGAGMNQLGGNNAGSFMSNALSPYATGQMLRQFNQGPESIGQYGVGTDLSFKGPQFGKAGSLDATGAFSSMLSGTPDYASAQGAIDAANAPLLQQLNQEIIPGLNQKATFMGNSTGGIKALNKIMPELGERMSNNAMGIMEGERQRALGAQQWAAGQVSQGGLQANQMGLNRSMGEADLSRFNAQMGMQGDMANAGYGQQFRQDVMGLGGLAGNLAGQDSTANARIMAMFPQLAQAGNQPSDDAMKYGAYQRMLAEGQMGADINRWNFNQQSPYNQLAFQSGIYGQMANAAGPQQPSGSNALGALGGAISGSQLGGSIAGMFGGYNPIYGGGGVPGLPGGGYGSGPYIPQLPFQMPTVQGIG
jgi:hypothetical protein